MAKQGRQQLEQMWARERDEAQARKTVRDSLIGAQQAADEARQAGEKT